MLYKARSKSRYAGLACSSTDHDDSLHGPADENENVGNLIEETPNKSPFRILSRNKNNNFSRLGTETDGKKEIRAIAVIRRFLRNVILRRRIKKMRTKRKKLAKATRTASRKAGLRLLQLYKKNSYSGLENEVSARQPMLCNDDTHDSAWACDDPLQLEVALEKARRSEREYKEYDPMSCLTDGYYPSMTNDTDEMSDVVPINAQSSSFDENIECPLEGKFLC